MFDVEAMFFSAPGSAERGISVVFGVTGSLAAENRSDNTVHIVTLLVVKYTSRGQD
jgi:hypothetical protein